jgi:hypothetical protein
MIGNIYKRIRNNLFLILMIKYLDVKSDDKSTYFLKFLQETKNTLTKTEIEKFQNLLAGNYNLYDIKRFLLKDLFSNFIFTELNVDQIERVLNLAG